MMISLYRVDRYKCDCTLLLDRPVFMGIRVFFNHIYVKMVPTNKTIHNTKKLLKKYKYN